MPSEYLPLHTVHQKFTNAAHPAADDTCFSCDRQQRLTYVSTIINIIIASSLIHTMSNPQDTDPTKAKQIEQLHMVRCLHSFLQAFYWQQPVNSGTKQL